MAADNVESLVEEYKRLTVESDPYLEGEGLLLKIIRTREPAAIRLLLTLYPSQEGWNGDEMNEVTGALKDAPAKLFVPEFARLAAQVCRNTPELFDDLMRYVLRRHLALFLKSLPPLSAEDRELLLRRNEQSRAALYGGDSEEPEEVQARYAALYAGLGR